MIVTETHLRFWQSKQRQPAWTAALDARRQPAPVTPIDSCINAHAGIRPIDHEMAAHNLLVICRSHIRRGGDLVEYLRKLAWEPGTIINPELRSKYARKWAARIARDRKDQGKS
jgi:hypothetical protein